MTDPDPSDNELSRLRWQCRRGMLELDYLLMRFLDLGYRDLDPERQVRFHALLGCQDQDLSDWVLSRRSPEDPQMAELIRHIVAVASESSGVESRRT